MKKDKEMNKELDQKVKAVRESKLLTTKEAAAKLGVLPATLAIWRCSGTYSLPFIKIGKRKVMYLERDLDEFIVSGRQE